MLVSKNCLVTFYMKSYLAGTWFAQSSLTWYFTPGAAIPGPELGAAPGAPNPGAGSLAQSVVISSPPQDASSI